MYKYASKEYIKHIKIHDTTSLCYFYQHPEQFPTTDKNMTQGNEKRFHFFLTNRKPIRVLIQKIPVDFVISLDLSDLGEEFLEQKIIVGGGSSGCSRGGGGSTDVTHRGFLIFSLPEFPEIEWKNLYFYLGFKCGPLNLLVWAFNFKI